MTNEPKLIEPTVNQLADSLKKLAKAFSDVTVATELAHTVIFDEFSSHPFWEGEVRESLLIDDENKRVDTLNRLLDPRFAFEPAYSRYGGYPIEGYLYESNRHRDPKLFVIKAWYWFKAVVSLALNLEVSLSNRDRIQVAFWDQRGGWIGGMDWEELNVPTGLKFGYQIQSNTSY